MNSSLSLSLAVIPLPFLLSKKNIQRKKREKKNFLFLYDTSEVPEENPGSS